MSAKDVLKDLQLTTVEGISKLIEKFADDQIKKKETPEPLMKSAFEAVIEMIETHGGWDAGISRALDKVRLAYGIEKPKTKPQEDIDDDQQTTTIPN